MVNIEEHLKQMRALKQEIKTTKNGYRKNDMVRHYNKMAKQLKQAQMFLRESGRSELNGKVIDTTGTGRRDTR